LEILEYPPPVNTKSAVENKFAPLACVTGLNGVKHIEGIFNFVLQSI
jgi:hypothetical protein